MPERPASGGRSPAATTGYTIPPRQWLALAIGALVAGYSAAFGFAVINDTGNPVLAKAAYGGLAAPSERLADLAIANAGQRALAAQGTAIRPGALPPSLISGIGIELSPATRATIRNLALDALMATPLSSEALRQLAYIESGQAQRVRLLSLAQAVTRRDVLANLQLAELQLRRGAVGTGLAALNQSLVVSRTVDGAVFPILLTAAGANATAARQVGSSLRSDPIWSERMLDWSIDNPQFLPALSRIVGYLPATSPARVPGYGQQVIDLLVGQGRYAEAFRTYQAYAGRPAGLSRLTGGAYPPLDWKLLDNYDSGGRAFEDTAIEIFANPGRQGKAAQIYSNLGAGPRRLPLVVSETMGAGAELTFMATCLGNGSERPLPSQKAALETGTTVFSFTVPPASCPFQRIELGIAATNETASALLRTPGRSPDRAASARTRPAQID